jgi:hypothetical protein
MTPSYHLRYLNFAHTTYEPPPPPYADRFFTWIGALPTFTHANLPLPLTCCVIAVRTTSCRES